MDNIDHLIEDICVRHVYKNINKYITNFEKSLDIKLKLGCQKYEYCYAAKFYWYSDATDKKAFILIRARQQKMFSIESIDVNVDRVLTAKFKFHPENAL